jgi:hypothetical protein
LVGKKMVEDSPEGLLLIDQELGQRQPAPAASTGESGE